MVYSPDQVRLKYVVRFCMEGDRLKDFSPTVSTSAEPCLPSTVQGENCTPVEQPRSSSSRLFVTPAVGE